MAEASFSTQSQNRDPMDDSGIRLCKTSPKFLESNATSHTWVFSAIAELIDNAYDPDVRATQIRIDHRIINGQSCLLFIDDGNGLNEEQLYRMLSFGYSDKPDGHDYKPIGRYGNGFKSGSMRLGKDAMVLTKQKNTLSVGLLSQTFHERINADTVRIPIVTFDRNTLELAEPVYQNTVNLEAVLKHSIFTTADEVMDHLTVVPDFDPSQECGTKIVIWNLRELGRGLPELEYRRDIKDIVCADPNYAGPSAPECDPDSLSYEHSLRKYCSILYLRPRMKIYILDEKVRSRLIAKDLSKTAVDKYTMKGQEPLYITFGFNPSRGHTNINKDFGVIMYHKNRLIKAYEKVGYQKQATAGQGYGVVGVVEADFLTPNHNKQSFNADEKYHRVMNALAKKLNEYWDAKMGERSRQTINLKEEVLEPDCNWVQCDQCLKWRRLPVSVSVDPDTNWYCVMHPNEDVASMGCRAPEDKLDQGEVDLTTPSTYAYRQEKQKAASKKRRSSTVMRSRTEVAGAQEEEEGSVRPKRQRVQEPRRTALLNDVRRKIDQLNRHAQSLLAETPVAVGDVADSLHQDLERGRDDEESRTVLCVRCHAWKKLPVGARVDNATEWECKMHPDEDQRRCQPTDRNDDSDSRSSRATDESSNRSTPNNVAGPSGVTFQRSGSRCRSSSSAAAEIDVQVRPAIVTLDGDIEEEENDDGNEDIKIIQKDVAALASAVGAMERRLKTRPVKPETCSVGCQSETDSASADVSTTPSCSNCEAEQKLEEARREVAHLLNILLENQDIRPDNALETVKMLIKNEVDKRE